jgi:ribonuclease T2
VLLPEVSQQLKKLMPSFYYGSCLERHEWTKHGSCQNLTVDEYFSLAMRLASEVDSSPVGQYLTSHQGQTVKLSELRQVVRSAFGTEHEGKIYFGCKNKVLVDVYIQLPETIHDEDSLVSLVTQAPNNHFHDQCAQDVKISEFNKETWL